jgi:membrane protease YdiL (CAAX protease family)
MSDLEYRPIHPLLSILLTLLAVFICFQVVGPMLGFFIALPFYPGNFMEMLAAIEHPLDHPELKTTLFIMQGTGAILGLIIVPILLLRRQNFSVKKFFDVPFYLPPIILVVAIVIIFMVVDSVFIDLNKNIKLPEMFSELERKAKAMEDELEKLTTFFTKYESAADFILAFIVIAILPAIGEELVFRGLIQRDFYKATGNIHVAIWASAIIFSAIHLQFYGFLPRMLLGALFGYLYHWSGNLLMPILAHFVNNGFTVVGLYFYQNGTIDLDLENAEPASWPAVGMSAAITIILLYFYKRFYDTHPRTFASHPQ